MRIGYACLALAVPNSNIRRVMKKNTDEQIFTELIGHNLNSLDRLIRYNIVNRIRLFRISSDLIPFGSSPVNGLSWWELFTHRFQAIGQSIQESGMRVSMHPGQYTVLNSPNESVFKNALLDLEYHAKVLDALGLDPSHKIILHIGGSYGDKENSKQVFTHRYRQLPERVKRRLVIENDETIYHLDDVMAISQACQIPVVVDVLHHQINSGGSSIPIHQWIQNCATTWQPVDGPQKIHYSQQALGKRLGSHSHSIAIQPFLEFCQDLTDTNLDIMLEVKDKNLSALKCSYCLDPSYPKNDLEREWGRYKYSVLERSPAIYQEIRALFRENRQTSALPFYRLLEESLALEPQANQAINAADHVWGYFKDKADSKEKNQFFRRLEKYREQKVGLDKVKLYLLQLAEKYQVDYLLQSHYFHMI